MSKRTNESSQLSKEEFEAMEGQESSPTPTGSFARASESVMSGRKIVRRSGQYKIPVAARTGGAGASSDDKPNPFKHVSFTGLTSKSHDKPHTALPKTPAPPSFAHHTSPPAVMNAFASTSTGIPTPAPPPRPTNTASTANRLSELNSSFQTHILSLPVTGGDWGSAMLQYQAYYDDVLAEDASGTTTSISPAAVSASNNAAAAAAAPLPAANVASPAAVSFPSATKPSPSSTETTSPANDSSTPPPATTNTNDSKFYNVRARCLKSVGGKWISSKTGNLALERDDAGKRIVIRAEGSFKTMFLCPLPMEITKEEQKNAKGETKRFIQFFTQPYGRKEPLMVRLQTQEQELDTLYEKIRELGEQ